MRKSKLQSTSALDITGARIQPNLVAGDYNGYPSGDILDANAVVGVVKETSVSPDKLAEALEKQELYHDDGTGKMTPVRHPNYSTQPTVLPQKIGDSYVYEQVFINGQEGQHVETPSSGKFEFTQPETSEGKTLCMMSVQGFYKQGTTSIPIIDGYYSLSKLNDTQYEFAYDFPADSAEFDDFVFIVRYCEDPFSGDDHYYYYSQQEQESVTTKMYKMLRDAMAANGDVVTESHGGHPIVDYVTKEDIYGQNVLVDRAMQINGADFGNALRYRVYAIDRDGNYVSGDIDLTPALSINDIDNSSAVRGMFEHAGQVVFVLGVSVEGVQNPFIFADHIFSRHDPNLNYFYCGIR